MPSLYFGKFSSKYPQQIEEKFYAGGEPGSEWYGGIKPGDYVFPIYKGKVIGLWEVKEYGEKINKINKDHPGVVFFEEIKTFENPIRYQNKFVRYRYFEVDLNILNKAIKSYKAGFVQVKTTLEISSPERIEDIGGNLRNFYIMLRGQEEIFFENEQKGFQENDIRILIDNISNTRILETQIYKNGNFECYDELQNLYEEKNPEGKRYTIKELYDYAKEDKAPRKENYLGTVLDDLQDKGYYVEYNPVFLYDNLIVGRKRSYTPSNNDSSQKEELSEHEETEEYFEELISYQTYANLLKFNPNLILYGPPGTGKTYATKKIVECFEVMNNDGEPVKFSDVEKEGRVKFVTFHQAYSYEEFIEGIRPQLNDDREDDEDSDSKLSYKIEDGILKQLANSASMQYIKKVEVEEPGLEQLSNASRIWKVSLGYRYADQNIYNDCKISNEIAFGSDRQSLAGKTYDDIYKLLEEARGQDGPKPINDASSYNIFMNEMSIGDIVFIYEGPETIRDIGIITSDYFYDKSKEDIYPHRRRVKWLREFETPVNIYSYNGNTRLTLKSIYELTRINFSDIKKLLANEDLKDDAVNKESEQAPYYLIIDEINRGNIAKIFGELITLIEKDKREELSIVLPYSKKPFTLPANLYIIGTMNTADRSIAILDTALRRRFTFAEIEPDINVFNLPNENGIINDTVDLPKLLTKINEKITTLLDRDHRIGHSYLMGLINLKDLYTAWYYKIIPLLMEYFYNDISSVRKVIGSAFLIDQGSINYLSMETRGGEKSEFEKALLNIYMENTE